MGCGPSLRTRRVSSMHTLHLGQTEEPPRIVIPRGAKRKVRRQSRSFKAKLPPGYVILFAVDSYAHMPQLKAAVRDADAIGSSLMKLGFEIIVKLYDEQCTSNAMREKLRESCKRLPTRARVVVFFAGHGVRHAETGRTFYCAIDTEKDSLLTTAFDLETMFTLTDFLPFQQLWIFDFCFSGGAISSVVRRGAWENNTEGASISIMAAGRCGEEAVESSLLETPVSSPMITPEVSPVPSPVHAARAAHQCDFTRPTPVPKIKERRTKGLFTNSIVRALTVVHKNQRHLGALKAKHSLSQLFVNVRCEVQQKCRLLGVSQTPQLSTVQWYRNKRTEGVFFF